MQKVLVIGGSVVVVIVVIAVAAAACGEIGSGSRSTSPPANAKEAFEHCVSSWDGNHEGLEKLIREQLNDPGSMETHGTYYNSNDSISDGSITIRLDYGARNRLGGMVRTDARAEMNLDCSIKEVITYGF